jgi:hypothetical protein
MRAVAGEDSIEELAKDATRTERELEETADQDGSGPAQAGPPHRD